MSPNKIKRYQLLIISVICLSYSLAQTYNISGKVLNSVTKLPVYNVNIPATHKAIFPITIIGMIVIPLSIKINNARAISWIDVFILEILEASVLFGDQSEKINDLLKKKKQATGDAGRSLRNLALDFLKVTTAAIQSNTELEKIKTNTEEISKTQKLHGNIPESPEDTYKEKTIQNNHIGIPSNNEISR